MQTLQRLADEVNHLRAELHEARQENKEARLEIARLSGVVARLEAIQTAQAAQCVIKHNTIDSKLEALDDFKQDTGVHEINSLKAQLAKKSDWTTWGIRTLAAALLATSLAGGGWFARGCSPQQQVQVPR